MFNRLLKDVIKDIDEQPNKEMYRKRFGRHLITGAYVPMDWGALPSQRWVCFSTRPCTFEIFMEASKCSRDQLLTPVLASLPALERCMCVCVWGRGNGAGNPKLLITTLSFW